MPSRTDCRPGFRTAQARRVMINEVVMPPRAWRSGLCAVQGCRMMINEVVYQSVAAVVLRPAGAGFGPRTCRTAVEIAESGRSEPFPRRRRPVPARRGVSPRAAMPSRTDCRPGPCAVQGCRMMLNMVVYRSVAAVVLRPAGAGFGPRTCRTAVETAESGRSEPFPRRRRPVPACRGVSPRAAMPSRTDCRPGPAAAPRRFASTVHPLMPRAAPARRGAGARTGVRAHG